jgi:hypothetical protein
VIRNDEKLCRVGEREVIGEDLSVHVAVHTDERETFGLAVDLPGDASLLVGDGQSPVRVQSEESHE